MSGKAFDAGHIADLIEQNKQKIQQIPQHAKLEGTLEIINKPNLTLYPHLWEMASWEIKKIPLLLWFSLWEDHKAKKLKEGSCLAYRILLALSPVCACLCVFLFVGRELPWIFPAQFTSIRNRIVCGIIMIIVLVALVVLVGRLLPFVNMLKKENVLIHYTSAAGDTVQKNEKELQVREGSECFFILTFKNEHNVSIDDFTAKETHRLSIPVIGNLLYGIFSQNLKDPSVQTHATYHFTSGKLDATYVEEFTNHFPQNDLTIHNSQKCGKNKMREICIKHEVQGL